MLKLNAYGDVYSENSIFFVAVVECVRYMLNLGIIYAYGLLKDSYRILNIK
jgi:hypothetical protein